MLTTFILVVIGWIFFRAESITDAFAYLGGMFDKSLITLPDTSGQNMVIVSIGLLLLIEWIKRTYNHGLDLQIKSKIVRWFIYLAVILVIFAFGGNSENFIYFQF